MAIKLRAADHPWMINTLLFLAVALHATLTLLGLAPNIWSDFLQAKPEQQAGVYLGFLGASAIVSGFAGVVVVFGLSATSLRFRQFRVEGGNSLARNWTSTSASGLLAAGLSLAAALLAYTPLSHLAIWMLEIAVLLVVHGSIRLVWLLRGMVNIVKSDDIVAVREARKATTSETPWMKNKAG